MYGVVQSLILVPTTGVCRMWEVFCPSAKAFIQCCRRTLSQAHNSLQWSSNGYSRSANRCRCHQPLSQIRIESKKMAPKFISPFPIERIINLAAVRLKLPGTMLIHPTFHVSKIMPAQESSLMPCVFLLHMVDRVLFNLYSALVLFDVEEVYSIWLTGKATVLRQDRGWQPALLSTICW